MTPGSVSRRSLLRYAGVAGTAGVGGAVVGYAVPQNDRGAHSYADITGVWTTREASRPEDKHSLITVAFRTESATTGEEVGTFQPLVEEDGAVVCTGTMLAHHADPPTYWVDVESDGFPCSAHLRYRFRHDPEGESHDPPGESESESEHLHLFVRRVLRAGTDEQLRYDKGVALTRERD